MSAFSELGLSDNLVSSISKLGFEEPTPIQQAAIPALLEGSDVLGQAATGTGKTAAFSLPLIERYAVDAQPGLPLILILTPTRELCLQVSESIHNFGKDAEVLVTPIYGGQEYSRQIRSLKRGTHIVVATPGRALDHINKGTLQLENIRALVLDEADEMLDLGFADELYAIFEKLPENIQTALFSATLPPKIAKIAEQHLKDPVRISIAREEANGEAPRVPQIAYVVGHTHRLPALGRILDIEDPELAIIFTRTRTEVDDLSEALRARGYTVEGLHGGLDQDSRDRVMKRARAGSLDAIVATDVAARGIDLENLTHVINYGIPASYETYVHRIGRTGRAGRTGTAITLIEPRETRHLRNIERITKSNIEIKPVPSVEGVRSKRIQKAVAAVGTLLEDSDFEDIKEALSSLSERFEMDDIAAACLLFALENDGILEDDTVIPEYAGFERRPGRSQDKRGSDRKPREVEEGMTRIFLGIGRDVGIRPNDIVGAIANEADISSKAIGAIDISPRFTLVDVESGLARQVVDSLQTLRFRGKPVLVKLDGDSARAPGRAEGFERRAQKNYRGNNDKPRREESRSRSDRPESSGRFSRYDRYSDRIDMTGARRRGPRR